MGQFRVRLNIDRSADDVFAYLNSVEQTPQWEQGLVEISAAPAGPLALGSVVRKVARIPVGRVSITQEVTAFDAARRTRVERVVRGMLAGTTASWRVEPTTVGSTLTCTVEVSAGGVFKLGLAVLARQLRRQVEVELGALKQRLEEGATPA